MVAETWQGLAIFTAIRHCMVREEKTRRPFRTERHTETESVERYRVLHAYA